MLAIFLHVQTRYRNLKGKKKSNEPRENLCNIFIRELISKVHEKLQQPTKVKANNPKEK